MLSIVRDVIKAAKIIRHYDLKDIQTFMDVILNSGCGLHKEVISGDNI